MDKQTFEYTANDTRLQDRARTAAYLYLVKGQSMASIADNLGITRQAVHRSVKAIERKWRELHEVPSEWEVVTVAVPPEDAKKIRKYASARTYDHKMTPEAFFSED